MLNNTLRGLGGIGAIALMVLFAFALGACGGSENGSTVADPVADDAAHVEEDADEAAHEDDEAAHDDDEAAHDDDEAAHDEGDEATDADEATHDDDEAAHEEDDMGDMDMGDAEANAYLEAAPKDSLYLFEMTNFAFTPAVLEVNTGEVLEIAVQNVEAVLHDFTIEKIDADVHISYLEGSGQHAHAEEGTEAADVHFPLSEPGVGVVHLMVHEPGEYVIYCSVPGHREAGMEGTLIVR